MDQLIRLRYLQRAAVAFVLLVGGGVNAQRDGAITASSFLRRGNHASVVAGNYVYIDGGEFSTSTNGSIDYEYSNTLLALSLSQDWSTSDVTFHSTSKPASVPSLEQGGLWYDESSDMLFTAFAGRPSAFNTGELDTWPMGVWSFAPDGLGSGTWGTAVVSDDPALEAISRPYQAAVASGNGIGYALGGSVALDTAGAAANNGSAMANIGGMLRFDMARKRLTNVTVEGPRFGNGHVQQAQMLYVPNFGSEGVFVVLGGVESAPATDLLDWSTVTVYDPDTDTWYDQESSGNVPTGRTEFCAAGLASDDETYEIFVYAGWDGDSDSASTQFDRVYILTLPAFHWIKFDHEPNRTRRAFTCHAVGGSQILTIGGLDVATTNANATPEETPFIDRDSHNQGLAIFDMSTLSWSDDYRASAGQYTQSDVVHTFYEENDRNPAAFNSTAIKNIFSKTNFHVSASKCDSGEINFSKEKFSGILAGVFFGGIICSCIFLCMGVCLCGLKRFFSWN